MAGLLTEPAMFFGWITDRYDPRVADIAAALATDLLYCHSRRIWPAARENLAQRHEHTTSSNDDASSTESIFDASLAISLITLSRYSIGSRGSKRAQQKADVYLFRRQQLLPQAAVH